MVVSGARYAVQHLFFWVSQGMMWPYGQCGFVNLTPNPLNSIVLLEQIEHGFGYSIIRSPYTQYSIYLDRTINLNSPNLETCRMLVLWVCLRR